MRPFSQGTDPPRQVKCLRRNRLSRWKAESQLSSALPVPQLKQEDVLSPQSIQSQQPLSQPSQSDPAPAQPSHFDPAPTQPPQSPQSHPRPRHSSVARTESPPREPSPPLHTNQNLRSQDEDNVTPHRQSLPWVSDGSQLASSQKSLCRAKPQPDDEIQSGRPVDEEEDDGSGEADGEPSSGSPPRVTLPLDSETSGSDDAAPDLGQSYHIRSFVHVLKEAVAEHQHCLPRGELELAQNLLRMEWASLPTLYVFVRMYRRKHGWLKEDDLKDKYEDDLPTGSTVPDAVKELQRENLLQVLDNEHVDDREAAVAILRRMKVAQLRPLYEMMPGWKKVQSKKAIVAQLEPLLKEPSRSKQLQSQTRPLFAHTPTQAAPGATREKVQGTLTKKSPGDRILRRILETNGTDVRIPDEVVRMVQRIHLVATLRDDNDVQRDLALAFTAERRYYDYAFARSTKVFPSETALAAFEHAREMERQLEDHVASKDWTSAASVGAIAEHEVRKVLAPSSAQSPPGEEKSITNVAIQAAPQQTEKEVRGQLEHPFLRRYSAYWVYLRMAWRSVAALEALGEHETAVKRLELLLKEDLAAKRRGRMLNRLTINLKDHLKRPEEAMRHIKNALGDDSGQGLHFGDRLELAKRAENIHRDMHLADIEEELPDELKGKKRTGEAKKLLAQSLPKVVRGTLDILERDITEQKFYRVPVTTKQAGKRKRAEEDLQGVIASDTEGKASAAARRGRTGAQISYKSLADDKALVGVEELAMEWYAARGDWTGCHDEGGAFRFIFALLFWEAGLFAPVPDVFHTRFQDRPLDLHTEAFYNARKEGIDARLAEIERMAATTLQQEVQRLYDKYQGTECVGCRWEPAGQADRGRVFTEEQLACIAGGIGGEGVAKICELLAKDYNYWGGGIADVMLWKQGDRRPHAMLVEVKSARDSLSSRQRAWLAELEETGVECKVFKVVEKQLKKDLVALGEAELGCEELAKLRDGWSLLSYV